MSDACSMVSDGDLDAPPHDLDASVELFAAAGVCVFRDLLALDVVDRLHDVYVRRAQEIDAGLTACAADLDTQFRFNEVIRRRAARYDIRFPASAAALQGEDEP